MKKMLFVVFCLLIVCGQAKADRCILNSVSITQEAFQQLQSAKTVIHYCPTCIGDNRVRYIRISDLRIVQQKTKQMMQVGDEYIDLAYIYIPTNKANIYRNLGYIVNCTDLKGSPVLEFLDVSFPYGIETIENYSKQLDQCQMKKCIEKVYQDILNTYFDVANGILKGFPFDKVVLPNEVSKENVQKLLSEISHYYGVESLPYTD